MSLTTNSSPFFLSTPPDQVKAQKEGPSSDQLLYDNLNLSKAGNQAIQKRKKTTAYRPCHSLISPAKDATHFYFITWLSQPTLLHVLPITNSPFTPSHHHAALFYHPFLFHQQRPFLKPSPPFFPVTLSPFPGREDT